MPTRRVMAARVCSGVHSEWWSTYVAASDSRSQALSMACSMLSISVSLPVRIAALHVRQVGSSGVAVRVGEPVSPARFGCGLVPGLGFDFVQPAVERHPGSIADALPAHSCVRIQIAGANRIRVWRVLRTHVFPFRCGVPPPYTGSIGRVNPLPRANFPPHTPPCTIYFCHLTCGFPKKLGHFRNWGLRPARHRVMSCMSPPKGGGTFFKPPEAEPAHKVPAKVWRCCFRTQQCERQRIATDARTKVNRDGPHAAMARPSRFPP